MDEVANHKTITHEFPIWRDKADFILVIHLSELDVPKEWKWEQIWAKQLGINVFEICCIPFVSYGLALGDWVTTRPFEERTYVIDRIVKKNGHTTYRVWFNSKRDWGSTIDDLQNLGCFVEARWEKSGLIAVDAPGPSVRSKVEVYLKALEATWDIEWEIGT